MVVVSYTYTQKISGDKVLASVKTAFQKRYPNAKGLKWGKEKGNYEAEFELNKTEYSLLMEASGNMLETEVAVETEMLPPNAKNYVVKTYPGKKIKEAAKITCSTAPSTKK